MQGASHSRFSKQQTTYDSRAGIVARKSHGHLRSFACKSSSVELAGPSTTTVSQSPAAPTYSRPTWEARASAVLTSGALLGFAVASDDLPALRLTILTYALWAGSEWVVHRYKMGISWPHLYHVMP